MADKTKEKSKPHHPEEKQPFFTKRLTLLPLVVFCGLAVSAVMFFGNPALWISEEQSFARSFSEHTDKEDYQFLLGLSDAQIPASSLVSHGEYRSISLDDTAARTANAALAAQAIDGYEIKPGETLSFNQIVENSSGNEPYHFAQEFDGYEAKSIRGAGISQVASTLYIAALKADLEIVERHAFSVAKDYVPLGFDAAVGFGDKDLKVKNTRDRSLYVRATASGQTVEVKLYGVAAEAEEAIDTVSETVDSEKKPLQDITQNPLASGEAELCTVTSYRIYSVGEKEIERETLATNTYLVSPSLI